MSKRWGWTPIDTRGEENQASGEPQGEQDETKDKIISKEQEHPESWQVLLFQHRWLLGLVIVLATLVVYIFLFAPPRLGGQIPIHPHQPGRPFYSLHWLRGFARGYYETIGMGITLLGSLLSFGILVSAHLRRWRLAGEVSLLLISLTLAFLGQWLLNFETEDVGAIIYVVAIIGFVTWVWVSRKRINRDLAPNPIEFRPKELLLVVGIFGLAAFARLYALSYIPYGVEGDETKWVYEVVQLMVDGQSDLLGEYHRDALPLSFYMQAPFQQLLEAGIHSARLGVVFYSLVAILAFYWLARQLAPLPLTLLATFLLSISVMDISASRLANVESHVKLWPILALAFLAAAVRTRQWEIYALSGLALTLGLLTYDTVWPIFFVVVLLAVLDLIAQPESLKARVTKIAALLLPSLLAVPVLIPYFASRLSYYRLGEKGWQTEAGATMFQGLAEVLNSWFILTRSDFIYNRQGPILNAVLLPLFVLGVVIAFLTLRSQFSRWMLLWAGLFLLPVPVLTTSPFGRIYYPALPAVYALIALGLYLLGREGMRLLGPKLLPLGYVVGIAALVWLPLLNLYIYFNEVEDPLDRLIRSDIGELAQQAASLQSYIYLPYYSEISDPLYYEDIIVKLGMRQHLPVEQLSSSYERILYNNLLPTLLSQAENEKNIAILFDKHNLLHFEQREKVVETLLRCFPEGILYEGHFFDRYSLEPSAFAQPVCLPVQASLSLPEEDGSSDSVQLQKLIWALSSGTASGIRLLCNQGRTDVIRIEGEDFIMGDGWRQDIAYVTEWEGQGYLADSYNSDYVSTLVHLPVENQNPGQVFVWVRYYKRAVDNSPAYIILDNQYLTFADAKSDDLNVWVWERVGPFYPDHDLVEWEISRPFQDDPYQFFSLFIDAVVFTTAPQFSPEDESFWDLTPVATYTVPTPAQKGKFEIELAPGHYSCAIEIESELPLVDAYGQTPVKSNIIDVVIPEP